MRFLRGLAFGAGARRRCWLRIWKRGVRGGVVHGRGWKAYGSLLAVTPMGVFLKTEMLVASSLMNFAESSRSRATLAASFPVSFWTFCEKRINLIFFRNLGDGKTPYLDMSLDLRPQLLQMLHDGAINRPTQICVLVSDDPSFVSYAVVDVLKGNHTARETRALGAQTKELQRVPAARPRPGTGYPSERALVSQTPAWSAPSPCCSRCPRCPVINELNIKNPQFDTPPCPPGAPRNRQ